MEQILGLNGTPRTLILFQVANITRLFYRVNIDSKDDYVNITTFRKAKTNSGDGVFRCDYWKNGLCICEEVCESLVKKEQKIEKWLRKEIQPRRL
jgi:hypothetical protein